MLTAVFAGRWDMLLLPEVSACLAVAITHRPPIDAASVASIAALGHQGDDPGHQRQRANGRGGRHIDPRKPGHLAGGPAFYRGQDDAVYLRTVCNGTWSPQTSLGGAIIGAPSAAIAGQAVVGARGTGNALWVRKLSNGTWGPWRSWGDTMSA